MLVETAKVGYIASLPDEGVVLVNRTSTWSSILHIAELGIF
jgi:hypothetical protein